MILSLFKRWSLCSFLALITSASASDIQVAPSSIFKEESLIADAELPMELFMRALAQPSTENEPEKEDLPKTTALPPQEKPSQEPEDSSDCSECSDLSNALSSEPIHPSDTAADKPTQSPEQLCSPEVSQVEA